MRIHQRIFLFLMCTFLLLSAITDVHAESSLRCSIKSKYSAPRNLTVEQGMTVQRLREIISLGTGVDDGWYLDAEEPGRAILRKGSRSNYLRVSLEYEEGSLVSKFCSSKNILVQSEKSSSMAYRWRNEIDTRITRLAAGATEGRCPAEAQIWDVKAIDVPADMSLQLVSYSVRQAIDGGGNWTLENHRQDVIDVAINIRRHYLKVIANLDTNSVQTMICDSKNLLDRAGKLHKNAYLWKQELDAAIKASLTAVSLGDEDVNDPAALSGLTASERIINGIRELDSLRNSGAITEDEFVILKSRLLEEVQ